MNDTAPGTKKLITARRKMVSVSDASLVEMKPLEGCGDLPLLVEPARPGVALAAWAQGHRDLIGEKLKLHGGLLFRGFGLATVEDFGAAVRAISGDMLEYRERSSPRHAVSEKIYTSTDYPPDQPIFLHNENSYQHTWPMRIFFYCHVEPAAGGETPIADVRKIFAKIPPAVRERFLAKKWAYVRNFGDGFGLPWQTVFQTENRADVEAYCAKNGIVCEWREDGRLRTRAIRPAAVIHPESGQPVWFNHATFFNVSTLTEAIRESLLQEFEVQDLPANTYYGDGSVIEPEVLDQLRAIYHEETIAFPWRKGDLLLLDNMMVAHGRAPFSGERQILVAMADPRSWGQVEPAS
ncbi:MAG: TauD/TfdA family dioxygenase [Thermoanaerobaculia bacterium]|nr:TauD/TfdA family dioxygenase [Thermoanaerobaculia bacterium]